MRKKNQFTALGGICLILLISALIFTSACAQPAPAPPPKPAPTPAPTPTPTPTKQITLKFGHFANFTMEDAIVPFVVWYLDEIEKRTAGAVKFDRYWGGTLVPPAETLAGVGSGIADILSIVLPYITGKAPLQQVNTLPRVLSEYNLWPRAMAQMDLYNQVPEVKEEITKAGAFLLFPFGSTPGSVMSTKPVRSIADMKGMKLRSLGYQAQELQKLGATPVSMPVTELFEAIQKGVVEGHVGPAPNVTQVRSYEICKNYFNLKFGDSAFMFLMRQKTFDDLAANVQKVIKDLFPEAMVKYAQIWAATDTRNLATMKAAGVVTTQPTAEDVATLHNVDLEIEKQWVTDYAAKGLPGQKVLDELNKLLEKYKPLDPLK